jgi:hypothetical protein
VKERKHLDNADCKNIGDRAADVKETSDPIEAKKFLEILSDSKVQMIVSFHALGQIPLLFQRDYS